MINSNFLITLFNELFTSIHEFYTKTNEISKIDLNTQIMFIYLHENFQNCPNYNRGRSDKRTRVTDSVLFEARIPVSSVSTVIHTIASDFTGHRNYRQARAPLQSIISKYTARRYVIEPQRASRLQCVTFRRHSCR